MISPDQAEQFYLRNIHCLRQTHPELVSRLDNLQPASCYQWVETQTEHPTLEIQVSQNPILLHSRHDPMREAKREIRALSIDTPSSFIFLGLGLGYSLEVLWDLHREETTGLLLVERNIELFYFFLHRRDWTSILSSPNLRIVIPSKPADIVPHAHSLLPHIMGSGIRFVDHRPLYQIYTEFYAGCVACLRRFLQQAAAESEFLVQYGSLVQRNAIRNLPAMCRSHGLGPLRDYYKDQPAVLIAAGPSLHRNLAYLKKYRKYFFVFCVDTAYPLILQEGIVPDFVAATDPTELNQSHFQGLPPREDVVLLFESDVYSAIPDEWQGPLIFVNSEKASINLWIEEIAGPFGSFDQGLSVAHTQFTAASWMGCNPMILIGHDFAYSTGYETTHAKGTVLNRHVTIPSPSATHAIVQKADFHPAETNEEITWVLGVRGEKVPTSKTLYVLLNKFSEMVRNCTLSVFDATEGGALIEGTIPTQFENIVTSLESRANAPQIVPFLEEHRDPQENSRLNAFERLIEALSTLREKASDGREKTQALLSRMQPDPIPQVRKTEEWQEIDTLFWELYRDPVIKIALEQALFPSMFMFIRREKDESDLSRLKKYEQVFQSMVNLINDYIPEFEQSYKTIASLCR